MRETFGPDTYRPPMSLYPEKRTREYAPTYGGGDISATRMHRIADAVWHIPGWLEPEDAMKLYELAYFAAGPILEVGTFCGRSATVMATAVSDRRNPVPVVSLDTDPAGMAIARRALKAHNVDRHVVLACASATDWVRAMPAFRPALVFLDADHSAPAVCTDLDALEHVLDSGALILCHDYLPLGVPDTIDFPISPHPIAVTDGIERSALFPRLVSGGTFGCSGLFQVQ